MATISKQHDFTSGTTILSAQVNTNFDDLFAQINDEVVHVDGTNAMTALLTGPATDPTADNHLARKKYVDDQIAAVSYTDGFAAQKGAAAGIATGSWTTTGSVTEEAGAANFDGTSVFTAPREGLYYVWYSLETNDASDAYSVFLRAVSNHSGWSEPQISQGVYGPNGTIKRVSLAGVLPCASSDTITYNVRHSRSSTTQLDEIYLGAQWISAIPS